MSTTLLHTGRIIGWNGIRVRVPPQWETIVSNHNHLIFEDNFKPVFQIRWKKIGTLNPLKWKGKSDLWWQQLGVASSETKFPALLSKLTDKFTHTRYYNGKLPMTSGGICYCSHCQTVFFFQQLGAERKIWQKTAEVLSTLTCHGFSDNLWQIQDFTLNTPTQHTLIDSSFKAGLTRLTFEINNCSLHICRLGQATSRLESQSLKDILLTLAGTRELQVGCCQDKKMCSGRRTPSVARQILLRMRKEKPFIESKIWMVPDYDRILACVATSKRPISHNYFDPCYETLKIV